MILACRLQMSPKTINYGRKPRFRRRTVFAKNPGFDVGFGYRNNTTLCMQCLIMTYSASLAVFMVYSDIDEDVRSLKEFSTALVVEATARCLHAIDSSLDVQHRLPPSMAAQFRIGTSLATAVQVRFADAHSTKSVMALHVDICVSVTPHAKMAILITTKYCLFMLVSHLYFSFTVHQFSGDKAIA